LRGVQRSGGVVRPLLLSLILVVAATAQTARFEVASVRISGTPEAPALILAEPGGRVTAPNSTLRELISAAYRVQDNELFGGPEWIARDRFALVAQAANPDATNEELQAMLASLLAERFQLVLRGEQRELPVYALASAQRDGRPGAQMNVAGPNCAPISRLPGAPIPPPPPPFPANAARRRPLTPPNVSFKCPALFFPGAISGRAVTMSQFAQRLTPFMDRPVIDRTGLTGLYDFDLTYTPERAPNPNAPLSPTAADASIFTAIREQLGLVLRAERAPLDVLVIERVERPSAN